MAAAEVVAAMNGQAVDRLSNDPVGKWASEQTSPNVELRETAKNAVSRVFQDSEFREIWEDSGEEALNSWKTEIDDLVNRLS